MAKAIWNGVVLAESDQTEMVEGNHYFPPHTINREYFKESSHHTLCPWKGTASYYTLEVNGQKKMKMPPGTIHPPKKLPATLKIMWRFGTA